MLVEIIIVSIIIGLIRGGRLSRLAIIEFKRVWIFVLALAIHLGIILFSFNEGSIVHRHIKELYVGSYGLLFIGLLINISFRSLWIIIIGTLVNLGTFITNGGRMPISLDAMRLTGLEELIPMVESGQLALYAPITDATRYGFLGDIITVPPPYPFPQILSIGDVIIGLGLFVFIQTIMLNEGLDKSKMVRFKYGSRLRL